MQSIYNKLGDKVQERKVTAELSIIMTEKYNYLTIKYSLEKVKINTEYLLYVNSPTDLKYQLRKYVYAHIFFVL